MMWPSDGSDTGLGLPRSAARQGVKDGEERQRAKAIEC